MFFISPQSYKFDLKWKKTVIDEEFDLKDCLRESLDYFSDYPEPFSLQDFVEWTGCNPVNSDCCDLLESDGRFVALAKPYLDNEKSFMSELSLFRWWFNLNLHLSENHINKTVLTQQELSQNMGLLTGKVEWKEFHNKTVEYGEKFGFIFYNPLCSCYTFPLSHLFSHIRRHNESCVQGIEDEFRNTERKNNLLKMSFPKTLTQYMTNPEKFYENNFHTFKQREQEIIESRFFKNMTLGEIGKKLGVTRERVRQIEARAILKIPRSLVFKIFLAELIRKSGTLLIKNNSNNRIYIKFIKSFLEIPYSFLQKQQILFFGMDSPIDLNQLHPYIYSNDTSELTQKVQEFYPFLSTKDFNTILNIVRRQPIKRTESVYLALKNIGKPAHFTEIADTHNKLFPDKQLSYHSVHSTLSLYSHPDVKKHGIVWVGKKGTYALKEWGYERPNRGLYDAIENIVNRLYKKTGKPVSYNVVLAEISKERVINSNSVIIALGFHKKLKKVQKNLFVPYDKEDNSDVKSNEEELDKILSAFQENQKKS